MGDKVLILKGDAQHREVEGPAEIDEVIDYLGAGDYLIWCIFETDKTKTRVQRIYNIDEKMPGKKVQGVSNE
jgi:hypothetical protein